MSQGDGPVQFDAVLVRISQVERFADTMVSGAVKGDARPHHAAQSVGESGPRRVQDGVVVESVVSAAGAAPRLSQVLRPM